MHSCTQFQCRISLDLKFLYVAMQDTSTVTQPQNKHCQRTYTTKPTGRQDMKDETAAAIMVFNVG